MKVAKGWVVILLALAFGWMLSWIVSATFGFHGWYITLGSIIFVLVILELINRRNRNKEIHEMAKHDWDSYAKDMVEKMGRGNGKGEDDRFGNASLEDDQAINPRDASACWTMKGLDLKRSGRHQEAIACFDRALKINPRDALAWSHKGLVLAFLGRHQEAIPCYNRALKINPGYAENWSHKGASLARLGRNQEAIACFKKFVEFAPPQYASFVTQTEEYIRQLEKKVQ